MNPIIIGGFGPALFAYLRGEKDAQRVVESCSIDEEWRQWQEEWVRYEARQAALAAANKTSLSATTYRDAPSIVEPVKPRANGFVRLWRRMIGALRLFTR